MSDVSITYQAHRAKWADMKDKMWHTQWHNSLGDMVGRDFPTLEEATTFAVARITNFGFVVIKDDEGQTEIIEVRHQEIYLGREADEAAYRERQNENKYEAERLGYI